MDTTTVIGVAGASILLTAFALTQFHEWRGDYLIYELCNLVGSLLLIIYTAILRSYPLLVLNLVWGSVALWYVIADLRRNAQRKDGLFSHRRGFFQKWME